MLLKLTVLQAGLAVGLAGSLLAQGSQTLSVSARMDIWQSGGYQDGSGGQPPASYTFSAAAGQALTFSSVTGSWSCGGVSNGPDGTNFTGSGTCYVNENMFAPTGPFSGLDLTDFSRPLVGMFLEDSLPTAPPPTLRFYWSDSSQGGIQTNFTILSPQIGQVFFIGDGLTGTGAGAVQVFNVPPTATHLYLGYVDLCSNDGPPGCYGDNSGSLTATFAISPKLEWIKPSLVGLPPARTSAAMVYDPAMGTTLLYGGNTYNTLYGDTWAFSKATGWTQLTPSVSPPPLQGASLAYDPTTRTVVLFGGGLTHIGQSSSLSNQTWTWDGVTWTQQFPPVSPPARNWNATNGMVFDSHLGKVVMFGGGGTTNFNDTWEWDGTSKTWTQQFPAHSPSPRTATLAYDESTGLVMLFGGNTSGVAYSDTWTYGGVDWFQQQPAIVPPTRTDNGLAYDPILKSVVLFGGLAGSCEDCGQGRLNDTWLWGGRNWTQVQTRTSPQPSSGISLTYDGSTKGMLLFGGWVSDFQFTSSTWIFKNY